MIYRKHHIIKAGHVPAYILFKGDINVSDRFKAVWKETENDKETTA